MVHHYTQGEIEFLKKYVTGRSIKELTQMFNENFNTSIGVKAIGGTLKRNGLTNGVDRRFKRGQAAWNKGLKGIDLAGENGKKTQFKKGQKPWNYKPIGTELTK